LFSHTEYGSKKAKEVASKADVGGEGIRHQVYRPLIPPFFDLF